MGGSYARSPCATMAEPVVSVGKIPADASSASGFVPGDARNVRSGDADVGQFPVIQLGELTHAGVVALPRMNEIDDGDEHEGPLCQCRPGAGFEPGTKIGSMMRCKRWPTAPRSCKKRMA